MKIFADNKVYVQKCDMMYFMRYSEGEEIPACIFDKIFGNGFFVLGEDRFDWIELDDPEAIDYFKKCDWILDYEPYKESSAEDVFEYYKKVADETNKAIDEFNDRSEEYREEHFDSFSLEMDKMGHKVETLKMITLYKKGDLPFILPTDKPVTNFGQEIEEKPKKENIIQKALRRFKGNKF